MLVIFNKIYRIPVFRFSVINDDGDCIKTNTSKSFLSIRILFHSNMKSFRKKPIITCNNINESIFCSSAMQIIYFLKHINYQKKPKPVKKRRKHTHNISFCVALVHINNNIIIPSLYQNIITTYSFKEFFFSSFSLKALNDIRKFIIFHIMTC
jgi:hypothetical protein